jgi:CRISPR-associated protein Csm4
MKIYKLTIEPLTSFRTPLQSDTIFGHLMWALRYTEGEAALQEFLAPYRKGEPPLLLVSAGFPAGMLPVPVVRPEDREKEKEPERSMADKVVEDMLHKALEEDRYLPMAQWRKLAKGVSTGRLRELRGEAQKELRELRKTEREYPVTRTAVDRITGSAREGRLFVSAETFYGPGRRFEIWHKVDEANIKLPGRLSAWWQWVERNGFGRGKSRGHGAFDIVEPLHPAPGELPQMAQPNGFVTLSAWVPKEGDPTDVTYRTRIKRGKLAEALAIPSPWKKPLLMLEPGAVARLREGERLHEWYGRLIDEVHWTRGGVVQYGYAFPLGLNLLER